MGFVYDKYRHSAASGNTWLENQAAFVWRWGFKQFGEQGARQAMGLAAEHGAAMGLMHNGSALDVARAAKGEFDRLMEGEVSPERSNAIRCAVRLWRELKPLGKPLSYQPWRPVQLGDLGREISLKPDFEFADCLVDAKATLAMPQLPRTMNLRQQALYSAGYRKRAYLLYVTPARKPPVKPPKSGKDKGVVKLSKLATPATKRWFEVSRQDVFTHAAELLGAFEQIERWDSRFNRPEDAVPYIPLNLDSFYWSDPTDQVRAIETWRMM